jgi:hypothetical protein
VLELVETLRNEDIYWKRANAASDLGRMGRNAEVATLALIEACADDQSAVREAAFAALTNVRQEVISPLQAALVGKPEKARDGAVRAAAMMGPRAAPLVPGLRAYLKTASTFKKGQVAEALGSMHPPALTARPRGSEADRKLCHYASAKAPNPHTFKRIRKYGVEDELYMARGTEPATVNDGLSDKRVRFLDFSRPARVVAATLMLYNGGVAIEHGRSSHGRGALHNDQRRSR